MGRGDRDDGYNVMHLMPKSGWWVATWRRKHGVVIGIDISTPPRFNDGEWQYVDLELDPLMHSNGRVELEDEDEFEEACRRGLIESDEATSAAEASEWVVRALQSRQEPFGDVGWDRLDAAVDLGLDPILEV